MEQFMNKIPLKCLKCYYFLVYKCLIFDNTNCNLTIKCLKLNKQKINSFNYFIKYNLFEFHELLTFNCLLNVDNYIKNIGRIENFSTFF